MPIASWRHLSENYHQRLSFSSVKFYAFSLKLYETKSTSAFEIKERLITISLTKWKGTTNSSVIGLFIKR